MSAERSAPEQTVISGQLGRIASLLQARRSLWEPRPFRHRTLPWEAEHPALSAYLRTLCHEEIAYLERQSVPELPRRLTPWRQEILSEIALIPLAPRPFKMPGRQRWKVSGRKIQQVEAFVGALLLEPPPAGMLVDWCSGKGHLGRTAAHALGRPLLALEHDPALVAAGAALCERWGVQGTFVCGSALDTAVLGPDRYAVALHACGHLTDALFRQVVDTGAPGVACVPCCCHRVGQDGTYEPMSRGGGSLPLESSQLRLATAEQVAGPPDKRRRDMAWRLGLDLVLREATGEDRYHDLPKLPRSAFRGDFATYVREGAARAGVEIPGFRPESALAAGWERARVVGALALVRAQFRRALELYIWLDRACFLEEAGYDVSVYELFPRAVSPRNVLIRAFR